MIAQAVREWIQVRKIRPDDPNLIRYVNAVHWKHLSREEAMRALDMDPVTFRRYERAYRRLQQYLCF